VPLIVQGDTIGLVEVVDQKRSRQYSRRELRLAGAIAGQAAVAIKNAKLFAERRRSDADVSSLRHTLIDLTARLPAVSAAGRDAGVLGALAGAVCEAFGAISCVASAGGESAGAFGAGRLAARPDPTRAANASLVVSRDPSGRTDLTLAVTLGEPPGEGQVELLDFIVAIAAAVAAPGGSAA
jgi:hypothetical protein